MRIKRLEIYGFKSFPYKVVLPFPSGISAIVGPNGAGKSNILDALRWVLGEQNPRRLRVREMADVIFAGENGRGPNFAEVRLVLDNEDRTAPKELQDLPEIVITRRLYRQGESEYLLNNRPCRLKDIVYLFLDTGAHPRAYGLIDQGQVGQFVEQSPKERRSFLEELAGVARYKMRREETMRQLNRTKENLVRLKDILLEVEAREAELERQAEEARTYLALQEEWRQVEIRRLHLLYTQAKARKERLLHVLLEHRKRLEEIQGRETQIAPEFEELAGKVELLRQELTSLEKDLSQAEAQFTASRRELEALLRRESELARQRERLEAEFSHRQERLEALRARLVELRLENEELKGRLAKLEQDLTRIKESSRDFSRKRRELEAKRESTQKELSRYQQERGRLKERLAALEREREKLLKRQRETEKTLTSLKQQAQEFSERKEKLSREISGLKQKLVLLSETIEDQRKSLTEVEEELKRLRDERQALGLHLKELQHEEGLILRFLEKEALPEAVKKLRAKGFSVRTLAEEVILPQEQERLAEWVLGEILAAILARDQEEALALARFLKDQGLSGDILWLKSPPEEFVQRRLAGVQEAQDLKTALETEGAVFTADGFAVSADGLISYRPARREPGLLQRRRRLEDLRLEMASLKERQAHLSASEEALRERRLKFKQEIQHLSTTLAQEKKTLASYERRFSELELKLNGLAEKETFYRAERQRLGQEQAGLQVRREKFQKELEALERHVQELERHLEDLEVELAHLRREQRGVFEQERALELELSGLRERMSARRKEEERLLKEEAQQAQDRARIQEKLEALGTELAELRGKLQQKRKDLGALEEKSNHYRKRYEETRTVLKELEDRFEELRKEREDLRREIDRLKEKVHRKEVDLAEVELTLSHLLEQAEEAYGVNLHEVEPEKASLKELEARREELKERLKAFQAVNLAAIEELEKVRERRRFLLEQREDLEKAISDLEQAVRHINQTCRTRLRETLKKANEKLAQIFPLLFPGGRAELKFVASDDPLEAGLDLEVKLPGKPIRHLAMLSGGEKALTALAVLCAFYLVKPGPFCVLDEVDAPLDEANTERFLELLQEMARYAQVILVTHNRRVMEAAEALFGITMEEKGISKVVSVRLTDQLPSRP